MSYSCCYIFPACLIGQIQRHSLSFLNIVCNRNCRYSKTCVKQPLSNRLKIGFQDQLSLNTGQKYCRMLQEQHSAILSIFIKLPFVIKIFVLSIFELPFYTGFIVLFIIQFFQHFGNMTRPPELEFFVLFYTNSKKTHQKHTQKNTNNKYLVQIFGPFNSFCFSLIISTS